MKTHVALLLAVTLALAIGCGSSGSTAATTAPPAGSSHDHGGGETDEHPHDDDHGAVGAADGHADEHSGAASSDVTEPARDACAEIAELCHDVDASNADAHDCHVIGHSRGAGAGCDDHLEHCRAVCTAAPGSGHTEHAH